MTAQLAAELDDSGQVTTDQIGPAEEQLTLLATLAIGLAKHEGSRPSDVLERAKSRATRLNKREHRTIRMEAGD